MITSFALLGLLDLLDRLNLQVLLGLLDWLVLLDLLDVLGLLDLLVLLDLMGLHSACWDLSAAA